MCYGLIDPFFSYRASPFPNRLYIAHPLSPPPLSRTPTLRDLIKLQQLLCQPLISTTDVLPSTLLLVVILTALPGEPLVDCEPVVIRRNEATLKSANGALAAGDSLVPLGHRRVDYYFVGRGGYTNEDIQQQAQGYILQLIGGILMPDHSGSQVHLAYLTLLEDLTVVRSWGSGCLAIFTTTYATVVKVTIPNPCNSRQLPHGKDWKVGRKDFSLEHHAQL
ncbi:hypothetical protein RHMOL_RhmolUnG0005800 [Rhododendron molle]|nr:hypothetical protein RHMOL_RhmolUnG0005800 [Rhododendron molle]